MSNKMLVTMKFDQRLMMSQQLRQAIALLQYNTLDLKQLIKQYIETNPLLEVEENENVEEEVEQGWNQAVNLTAASNKKGQSFDDQDQYENFSIPKTLRNYLLEQSLGCHFDKKKQKIAESIIDAIDDNGFLTMKLDDIRFAIEKSNPPTIEDVEEVLKVIQTLDPIGVGCRDLQECLLVQLQNLVDKDATWKNAHTILSHHFESIAKSNAAKLIKHLRLTENEYSAAIKLIRSLNPYPGTEYSNELNFNIEPELYAKKIKNRWQVFLSDSILTHLKINTQYKDLIKKNKKHSSYPALKQELNEARDLMQGLKRRNETLLIVGAYIVEFQQHFLELGPTKMRPMNIEDVASATHLHESTISRVTTGKYLATPRGIFELKYFFSNQVSTHSSAIYSAIAVKEFIKEIIHREIDNHVYSDDEIAELLQQKGINIARRTVAKYRNALKILPSYQRNSLQPHFSLTSDEEELETESSQG